VYGIDRRSEDETAPRRRCDDVSTAAYALPDRELVLERYRPLRPLGRGGSGSVWLARDERTGLEIALKIVPREGKRAARAMREMEAASRLRHERCVRAYDFAGDDGHVYIAYEYVAGSTLRELLRAGRLTDRDAVEVAAQVLEGLAHAHRHGIVHRDVKPSNVLVEDGSEVRSRLLDFGLAQFDEADTLTAIGDVPGTLAYIAPERLTGGEATTRSDVWAVGVMLWETLAGQHPFWGVPMPQVAAAIADGADPLATKRRDLPARLLAAVDRALATDPARRPSAAELADELREAFVTARTRPTGTRPRAKVSKPEKPRRVTAPAAPGVRLAGGALCALATGVGAALLPFWPPGLVAALAVAAGVLWAWSPRAGLMLTLAAPLFPLGNVAQGAAIAWAAFAVVWLAVSWRRPREGLVFCLGPLLAPLGLIALVPLAVQLVRGPVRQALHAVAAVLSAALVTGLSGGVLPVTGGTVGDLGVTGTERSTDVVQALALTLRDNMALLTTALVLALVAVGLPYARRRGIAGAATLTGLQLGALLLVVPAGSWPQVVIGTMLLFAILAAPSLRGALGPALVARRAKPSVQADS
jgi:eukaryotic-like serine/threonine-protein kinase